MPTFRSAWNWAFGKHEPKPPNPDRTVEAGWVPVWQGPMLTELLVDEGIPAVWTEDFNIHVGVYNREAMARIFVTQDREAEAKTLIEEFTGTAPRQRKL